MKPERCEVTEMLVDQCACRRHRNLKAPEEDVLGQSEEPGPYFIAKFSSYRCSDCGNPIEAGDRIRAGGLGGYQCEHCGGEEQEEGLAWKPKRERRKSPPPGLGQPKPGPTGLSIPPS